MIRFFTSPPGGPKAGRVSQVTWRLRQWPHCAREVVASICIWGCRAVGRLGGHHLGRTSETRRLNKREKAGMISPVGSTGDGGVRHGDVGKWELEPSRTSHTVTSV